MSETNNRNKQGPGLQDVREGGGALPDRGTTVGLDASYPNMGDVDSIARLGSVNGKSDAIGGDPDMPNKTQDFTGTTSPESMGVLGSFNAGSDPVDATMPKKP